MIKFKEVDKIEWGGGEREFYPASEEFNVVYEKSHDAYFIFYVVPFYDNNDPSKIEGYHEHYSPLSEKFVAHLKELYKSGKELTNENLHLKNDLKNLQEAPRDTSELEELKDEVKRLTRETADANRAVSRLNEEKREVTKERDNLQKTVDSLMENADSAVSRFFGSNVRSLQVDFHDRGSMPSGY